MATAASQMNVHEVINTPLKRFWKFISPRAWPHLAAMHDRVKKNTRVLTLQVNHCIIHILLKDLHLKTNLLNHVFLKKPSSMLVFNLTNERLVNHHFLTSCKTSSGSNPNYNTAIFTSTSKEKQRDNGNCSLSNECI